MKFTIGILGMLLCSPVLSAANQRAQGWCEQGGQVVVVNSGLSSTSRVQQSFPRCTVKVFLSGTGTLATLFSDTTGTTLANPFSSDTLGHWFFYAANGRYDVQISGGGLPAPYTFGDVFLYANDPTTINAKLDFGCVGDDVHDDTACFNAIQTFVYGSGRAASINAPCNAGGVTIYIPAGTYLVTSAQAFMSSAGPATCISGYVLQGAGDQTIIDYNPGVSGPLFYNNNGFLGLSFRDISFFGNDPNSDFFYSYSNTQAQDYAFYNVNWYGQFKNLFELHGTNTNSEFKWYGGGSYLTNSNSYFLYAPDAVISAQDQFFNYWINNMRIWNTHGNFILMKQGGHIVINDTDFSGNQGSGDPSAPNTFFTLQNNSHAFGAASFICRGSRFELLNNSVRVLYSEWGAYGQVSFVDNDFSSQALVYPSSTTAFYIDYENAGDGSSLNGAYYSFERDMMIGSIFIHSNNNTYGYRRIVNLKDCTFEQLEDWSTAIVFNGISGPIQQNTGGFPTVKCENCRGQPPAPQAIAWAGSTAYVIGNRVYSLGYTYQCITSGTSGTTNISGRSTNLTDGTAHWITVDTYNPNDYATHVNIKSGSSSSLMAMPTNATPYLWKAFLSDYTSGNALPHVVVASPSTPFGYSRVILPQNATVTKVVVYVQPGGTTQNTNGTYTFRTDQYSTTTLASFTYVPMSTGGYNEAHVYWQTGSSDFGARIIILDSGGTVVNGTPGYAYIEYY